MDFTPTQRTETYPFISPSQHNLTGRSVFITGASKGLGAAYAISYAKAGITNIGLSARSDLDLVEERVLVAAKRAERPTPRILKVKIDVTKNEQVTEAAERVKDVFGGGVDILINNAGTIDAGVPMVEVDVVEWWHTFHVNVLGTFHVTRAFTPLVLASSLKTIIMVGSAWGLTTFAENSAYQITKLTEFRLVDMVNVNSPPMCPAKEPGGRDEGLLCYMVHPDAIRTELAAGLGEKLRFMLVSSAELAADGLVWLTAERREWLRGRFVSCMWDLEEFVGLREEIVRENLLKVRMSVGG